MIYQFCHVIMKMLTCQLLIQKKWIIQQPNITFCLKLKAKLFISIQIQNHGMRILFYEEQEKVMMMMMMMMITNCFCGMIDRQKAGPLPYFQPAQLSEILTITNL